jgi:hypothetical protein
LFFSAENFDGARSGRCDCHFLQNCPPVAFLTNDFLGFAHNSESHGTVLAFRNQIRRASPIKKRRAMSSALKIDRQFLFLHGPKLAVFAERVLRDTQRNAHVACPAELWEDLEAQNRRLRQVLDDPFATRRSRSELLRACESPTLVALTRMADHVERAAQYKSDVFTTGFRPQTEHHKPAGTRRRFRLSARMNRLKMNELAA